MSEQNQEQQTARTIAIVQQELATAAAKQDWKAVGKLAAELDTLNKAAEKAEAEKALQALGKLGDEIVGKVEKIIMSYKEKVLELSGDGVWLSADFAGGSVKPGITMRKGAGKASSGGTKGGTGKKYDVSTEQLLEKFGGQVYKDGVTYQAAHDADTNGNKRYLIRMALLKLGGYIK